MILAAIELQHFEDSHQDFCDKNSHLKKIHFTFVLLLIIYWIRSKTKVAGITL